MKTKLLIAVLALQAAWVVATITIQEFRLRHGTVVLLETEPVDPRDLLRGDYVILNYKISTLSASNFVDGLTGDVPAGTPVYVLLAKRGEFHEPELASFDPIEFDPPGPVLKGRVSGWWDQGTRTNRRVRVDYGLERYYVREGTGNPRGKLTVEVSVPASGDGVIRQVYLDGKPYAEAMKQQGHPR
jgi:hypothetical protein